MIGSTLVRLFAGLAIAVGLASAAPVATAQDAKLDKMTLVVAGDAFFYVPLYIADKGGFFREEGLAVEMVTVPSGNAIMAAVAGGSVDAAFLDFATVIQAISKGSNLVALANEYSAATHNIVLSKAAIAKSGITPSMSIDEKLKRMKGLRIGVTGRGAGPDRFLRTIYTARGMNPDSEIQILPLGDGNSLLAAFEANVADGFVYTAPIPQIAVSKGLGEIVVNVIAGDVPEFRDVPYVVFITRTETLKAKPQVIEKAVRALTKALKSIQDKPDAARALTRVYFPEVDEGMFKASFDQHLAAIPKSPVVTQEQLTKTLAVLNIGQPTPVKATYAEVIDSTFAQRADKDIFGR